MDDPICMGVFMPCKGVGIATIGIHFPSIGMNIEDLALLRGEDPDKYTQGLGCKQFSMCSTQEDIAELALISAQRALKNWDGDISDIGMIAVGTESGLDMSRPLSAWVAERLHLNGMIRSYEVKHACYGGTLAIRQAVEWKLSGAAGNKAALVIAADISLYEPNTKGEPTQGAGAISFIIDEDPKIAEIAPISYPWSRPVFDFWRPLDKEYPEVDGDYSLECYKEAALSCFNLLISDIGIDALEQSFTFHCFHVPFPKMVKKAVAHVFQHYGWDDDKIALYFKEKIENTMAWNQLSGNSYTASLWVSVAKALSELNEGEKLSAFSYGSGYGAELLVLTAQSRSKDAYWVADVERDFLGRKLVSAEEYELIRQNK